MNDLINCINDNIQNLDVTIKEEKLDEICLTEIRTLTTIILNFKTLDKLLFNKLIEICKKEDVDYNYVGSYTKNFEQTFRIYYYSDDIRFKNLITYKNNDKIVVRKRE